MKLTPQQRLKICIVGQFLLLISVLIPTILFANKNSSYYRFGPNEELMLISIKINTNFKYGILLTVQLDPLSKNKNKNYIGTIIYSAKGDNTTTYNTSYELTGSVTASGDDGILESTSTHIYAINTSKSFVIGSTSLISGSNKLEVIGNAKITQTLTANEVRALYLNPKGMEIWQKPLWNLEL